MNGTLARDWPLLGSDEFKDFTASPHLTWQIRASCDFSGRDADLAALKVELRCPEPRIWGLMRPMGFSSKEHGHDVVCVVSMRVCPRRDIAAAWLFPSVMWCHSEVHVYGFKRTQTPTPENRIKFREAVMSAMLFHKMEQMI